MEEQLRRTDDDRHSYESLNPAGSGVHDESERGGETRSVMKKVKAKVEKLKATLKHGHGHGDPDDSEIVDDSPAVRCGLAEPTVMGKPVLAEDLYATHSDIVDPPVRSFAQWEEEEKRGAPPPLSTTGIYGTRLTDPSSPAVSHLRYGQDATHSDIVDPPVRSFARREEEEKLGAPPPLSTGVYGTQLTDPSSEVGHLHKGQDVNREQQKGDIAGKVTVMEENPITPNPTMEVSPATNRNKVTDPANTDRREKEAGITDVLRSFHKMEIFDQPESKTLKPDRKEPTEYYTGSHDQFAPEPVQNPPPDLPETIADDPTSQGSSYTEKLTSVTSAIAGKAATAKDMIASKLGSSDKPTTKSSFTTDYAHKVADALSGTLGPVYEKVVGGGSSAMPTMPGCGHVETTERTPVTKTSTEPENKGVGGVKEYLVETFTPGDDDKVLSEVITQVLHRGKPPQETDTTTAAYVVDEGERRLQQNSGN